MIRQKDVGNIARLARIELTSAEKEKFERELASILAFVAKLNELNTNNIEPLAGGAEELSAMRDDSLSENGGLESGIVLTDQVPKKRDGYVEVKAVFERE